MKKIVIFLSIVSVALFIVSCGSDNSKKEVEVESEAVEVEVESAKANEDTGFVEFEFSVLMANIPL